jgi:hypothetical protein
MYLLTLVTSDRLFQMDWPKFLPRQDNIAPNYRRNPLSSGTVLEQLLIRLRQACDVRYITVITQVSQPAVESPFLPLAATLSEHIKPGSVDEKAQPGRARRSRVRKTDSAMARGRSSLREQLLARCYYNASWNDLNRLAPRTISGRHFLFLVGSAQAPGTLSRGPCHHTPARMPSFFKWTLDLQSRKNDVAYPGKPAATGHG